MFFNITFPHDHNIDNRRFQTNRSRITILVLPLRTHHQLTYLMNDCDEMFDDTSQSDDADQHNHYHHNTGNTIINNVFSNSTSGNVMLMKLIVAIHMKTW